MWYQRIIGGDTKIYFDESIGFVVIADLADYNVELICHRISIARTMRNSILSFPSSAPTLVERPCQEKCGCDLLPPNYTNSVWPLLWLVRVMQKNKPLNMLSYNVQSIDLSMDCKAWLFLMMIQSNGCSTPAPRSSAAWQWITRSNNEEWQEWD